MSRALQTVLHGTVHAADAVAANPVLKSVCYSFIDHYLPGLGKKQKAEAVHRCSKIVDKLIQTGKKVTFKSIKKEADSSMLDLFGSWDNDVTSKMAWMNTPSKKGSSKSGVIGGGPKTLGGISYAPVSVSHNIKKVSKPKMSYRGDAIVVSHSEMLGSIMSGTPSSNVTSYRSIGMRANPGMSSVFPWLSTMAVNYEKYRFKSLRFTIVPLVSTNFSGRIGVGFDYDSSDISPGNRQEFYALTNHAESMPWEAASISVKCDSTFRFTGTHAAADNKLIDQGQVILMSDSVSNGGTIASAIALYDLIVDYTVELIEPQQSLFATQIYQATTLTNGAILGVGFDATNVVGPTIVTAVSVTSNTVLTISLPAGSYAFSLMALWSTGQATAAIATTTAGTVLRSNISSGTSFLVCTGTLTSSSDAIITVTTTGVGWASSLTRFNLMISRVSAPVYLAFLP